MSALLLATSLFAADAWEDWVFPVVDALELSLTPEAQQYRVGTIFVVGNDYTADSVILDQLRLYSGGRLCSWRMWLAEYRLARLGLFQVDLKRRLWPHVTALDPTQSSQFRDIE